MGLTDVVEEFLLLWVLISVGIGLLVPELAALTEASTLILAIMIGSISLTLSLDAFQRIDWNGLALILVGHVSMPFIAFTVAQVLGVDPALTIGFVVVGAVTPELMTPVMTELAGGDTALSSTALVLIGVGSLVYIPAVLQILVGDIGVPTIPIVEQLLVAVVIPMLLALGTRARNPRRVERYERYYPAISALMVILIIGGVTAANAGLITSNLPVVQVVLVGSIVLNGLGYVVGYLVGWWGSRATQIASVLSVGMRDFAVAAALIIAAGLPPAASLPAVTFGVVELASSAGLARWYTRDI